MMTTLVNTHWRSGPNGSASACSPAVLPCGLCKAREAGICSAVPGPELRRLADLATVVEVPRGKTFILEDASAEHVWILTRGSAKLYKLLADGRQQIIGFAYQGSLLGFVTSGGYSFTAEALETARICRISRARLQTALHEFRPMADRLLAVMADDLIQAHNQMLLLGRKSATERIASFLLSQATRPQPRGIQWPRIHLPMGRSDIADYLGVATETVSRTLATLQRRKIIALPNVHEIVVIDALQLEELANRPDLEPWTPPTHAPITLSS